MKFRTQFDGVRNRVSLHTGTDTLVEQSQKNACDIHTIMKRFQETGSITHVNQKKPQFGDFSNLKDFQETQNTVARTTEYFESLPSGVRKQFGNSVSEFAVFMSDDANLDKAVEMGIVEAPKIQEQIQETVKPVETPIPSTGLDVQTEVQQ